MIKVKNLASMVVLILLLSITFSGCGGGGGESNQVPAPNKSPSIQVSPSSYDFGSVTPGNSPAPLTLEIINSGSANLNVSSISLLDNNNFTLKLNGGTNPCNTASPTITAGSKCTAEVEFQPKSTASFSTKLTISSNDPNKPTLDLPLSATQEEISTLNVRINQVERSCSTSVVTAYVSVTDQGGYPVTVLGTLDFSVTETETGTGNLGYADPPASAPFVGNSASLSAALVMDYSNSVGDAQIADMVVASAGFVDQMGADDEAEIIKFSSIFEVVQPFTSDKNSLMAAINAPWDQGIGSVIWDTVWQSVDDTAVRSNDRKAVILISDGWDFSTSVTLDNVIDYALSNNVPIFSIGLGPNIILDNLTRLADETGGQYYEAATSDNLRTIHQQLADVLFSHQYIVTYTSNLGGAALADLTIGATLPSTTISGSYTKQITACIN